MISTTSIFLCMLSALASQVSAGLADVSTATDVDSRLAIAVTPSGHELVFDRNRRIQLTPIRGGRITTLSAPGEVACCPAVSPDGRSIAYQVLNGSINQIMVMNKDGSQRRQVTFGRYDHRSPVWMPDSKRLLMSANRGGDYGIWELHLESLMLRQTTINSGDELQPVISSDGSKIMYVAENREEPGIYTQRLGGAPVLVLRGSQRYRGPTWNPGETLITYVVTDDGNTWLEMLIPSAAPVRKILARDQALNPSPVIWTSRDSFLYTAGELIWERHFDLPWSRVVPIIEK